MKIVKIERIVNTITKFEVTIRHNWIEWLFGFPRTEIREFYDTGRNYTIDKGGSIYEDDHGNWTKPGDKFSEAIDNWRKEESLKRGL